MSKQQFAQRSPDAGPTDYYELLGVAENASQEQIKRAYRAAMKRIHPDRVRKEQRQQAEHAATAVNLAYQTLADPVLRRRYDAERRAAEVQDQIMSRYFGGLGAPGSESDVYEAIMRAARAQQRQQQKRHDRTATAGLLMVFTALLIAAVTAVLLWGVIAEVAGRVF